MPNKPSVALSYPSVTECQTAFAELRGTLSIKVDVATVDAVVKALWQKVFAYRPSSGGSHLRPKEHEKRAEIQKLRRNLQAALDILERKTLDWELPREVRKTLVTVLERVAAADDALQERPAMEDGYFVNNMGLFIQDVLDRHEIKDCFTSVHNTVMPLIGHPTQPVNSTLKGIARIREREGSARLTSVPSTAAPDAAPIIDQVLHKPWGGTA